MCQRIYRVQGSGISFFEYLRIFLAFRHRPLNHYAIFPPLFGLRLLISACARRQEPRLGVSDNKGP